MANNYGITEIDASPSQEVIDSYLNWCDENPPEFSKDVLKFNKKAKEKIKKSLEKLKKDALKLAEKQTKEPIKDLTQKAEIIKALCEPPTTPDACVKYCANLVKYFTEPYTKIVKLITWWTIYISTVTAATTSMISRIEKQLNAILTDPTGEKTEPKPSDKNQKLKT